MKHSRDSSWREDQLLATIEGVKEMAESNQRKFKEMKVRMDAYWATGWSVITDALCYISFCFLFIEAQCDLWFFYFNAASK